jgi:hypothetical protein
METLIQLFQFVDSIVTLPIVQSGAKLWVGFLTTVVVPITLAWLVQNMKEVKNKLK